MAIFPKDVGAENFQKGGSAGALFLYVFPAPGRWGPELERCAQRWGAREEAGCGLDAFWTNFDTFLTPNRIGFVPKLKIGLVTYKYMM